MSLPAAISDDVQGRSWREKLDLRAAPAPAFLWGSCALWLAVHVLLWLKPLKRGGYALEAFFGKWDSNYYAAIARDGADAAPRVFFPLYPQLVGAISRMLSTERVLLLGAGVSLIAFVLFVAWVARAMTRAEGTPPSGCVPLTRAGWLMFLFGPGTFIFHTPHTESLFLLLSFGALYLAGTQRPIGAGLFAAATTWTRNQGVFLSIGAALLAAATAPDRAKAIRHFLLIGFLSAGGFAAFLGWQHLTAGSALAFMEGQSDWAHADSPLAVVRTLWFGNPWQSTNDANLYRYAFFWVLLATAVLLVRRQWALAVYVGMSTLVMLLQGELVNAFRFGAVLFPAMFVLGDTLVRWNRWWALGGLLALAALNLHTARQYGFGHWAY